ncbi:hypothetical protein ACIBG4_11690 [Nonomuraea sp. NPDC050383]
MRVRVATSHNRTESSLLPGTATPRVLHTAVTDMRVIKICRRRRPA